MSRRDYARPQRPRPAATRPRPATRKAPGNKTAATPGLPLWAWMVVSLSLLVFAAAIYYVSRPVAPMDMAPSSGKGAKAKTIEIPPKEPSRFAFYEMLPSYEVVVPEEVINPPKPTKPVAARPVPAPAPAATETASQVPTAAPTTAAEVKAEAPKPAIAAVAVTPVPDKPAAPKSAEAELAAAIARESLPKATAQLAPGERFVIQVAAFRTRAEADARVAALTLAGLNARVEQVTIDNKDTWYRVRLGPYGSANAAATAQQGLKAQGFTGVVMKVKS